MDRAVLRPAKRIKSYLLSFLKIPVLGGMVLLLLSFAVNADFAVPPTDPAACYEFKTIPNFGNAQTCRFKCAMFGCPMTPEEAACLAAILPEKEAGHYYGRISLNSAQYSFSNVVNRSVNGPILLGVNNNDKIGTITRTHVSRTQPGIEIAVGYFYGPQTRIELEYLVTRNLNYNANPVFSNSPPAPFRALGAELQTNTVLLNFYYEFLWFGAHCGGISRFRPFVVAGIGAAYNTVRSTLTTPPTPLPLPTPGSTASAVKRYGTFAFDVGAGFRLRFLNRWSLVFSFRYVNMGTVRIQPTSTFRIQGTLSMTPISIGVMYLF